eukprot:CAMPEP_0119554352 /NCGR_PEP_ID=MMETSP1352-20130426/6866_1 /TAXON_ID=265584 /ORGANISM="Stauroneis constricta, Strain CCMP1120" /LENGTH=68 /DNA_ID=CAMNT_0007600927 /DNA_START=82 /DNA_END=288 /DNA_ORIENTATION=+
MAKSDEEDQCVEEQAQDEGQQEERQLTNREIRKRRDKIRVAVGIVAFIVCGIIVGTLLYIFVVQEYVL